MKNRRRHTSLREEFKPAIFDHNLFRHLNVTREGADVVDFTNPSSTEKQRNEIEALLSQHYTSPEYLVEHSANPAFIRLLHDGTSGPVLREIESKEPHIWFISQENGNRPYGYTFHTPSRLFAFLQGKNIRFPRRHHRDEETEEDSTTRGSTLPPTTKWIDIQTKGDTQSLHEILSYFPVDAETQDGCSYLLSQDSVSMKHLSFKSQRSFVFINLACTPVVTDQTFNLCCNGGRMGEVPNEFTSRGKSVVEMRLNAVRHNTSRLAVPDPVPVAVIAFPDWVITIHEKPFAEMDDLFRMLQVYCSPEELYGRLSFQVLSNQRFTTSLFVASLLRIAIGHTIDSIALAEAVNELGETIFDVPKTATEKDQVVRRINDTRRCFGECSADAGRREYIINTLLDPEIKGNIFTCDTVSKQILEDLRSHLKYVQHELGEYRDTVAASHWYHNVAVQRVILLRGNKDLRMILLLTKLCNIMYPIMMLQTLYSMNIEVPYDSEGEPPSTTLVPFIVTAIVYLVFIIWFSRGAFTVFRQKKFLTEFIGTP